MGRLPVSLQSLLAQCLALLLTAFLNHALVLQASYVPAAWELALAQGGIAAVLSRLMRQPVWWQMLHLIFFPLVLLALQAGIPRWVYLSAFIVLALFYWSTFRTRVPLYLSDRRARQALASLLPGQTPFRFIDLGSGLGDVPLFLEQRFPLGRFFGTEIAPAPWFISRVRAWLTRSRVILMRRDYRKLDLGRYDVVFAFLSPAAMPALWRQAQTQMRAGSLFISLSFAVDGREPERVVSLANGARHTLYAWRL